MAIKLLEQGKAGANIEVFTDASGNVFTTLKDGKQIVVAFRNSVGIAVTEVTDTAGKVALTVEDASHNVTTEVKDAAGNVKTTVTNKNGVTTLVSSDMSAIAPVIAKQVEDVGGKLAELSASTASWVHTESATIVREVAKKFVPEVKKALFRYYRVTRDRAALFDLYRIFKPDHEQYYIKRVVVVEECLDRTSKIVSDYKNHIQALGLASINSGSQLNLSDIANASHTLYEDAEHLAVMLAETQANKCKGTGADEILKGTLDDANKWQSWIQNVRANFINSTTSR